FSLMPEGLRKLVRDLQRVPVALGDGVKRPLEVETKHAGRDRLGAGIPSHASGRGAREVCSRPWN
ncbi:MAG TPA: hypothetical protein VIV12_00265, partial [Streptosporangiaceae bacterium]